MRIRIRIPLAITACLLLGVPGTGWAASIGGSFVGRGGGAGAVLSHAESAGVVPQTFWNNIDSGDPVVDGPSLALIDSAGNFTSVKIIYDASDSWNSDGGTATPDEKLMKGIIKANPDPDLAPANNSDRMTFVITNLPAGTYNVIVYATANGEFAKVDLTLGSTTYYIEEQNNFTASGSTFVPATSTTPGAYELGPNYAGFTNVSAAVNGTITITAKKLIEDNGAVPPAQRNDGIGVAAIQIVQVTGPAPAPNTDTCSITTNPQSPPPVVEGGSVTLTVGTQGPCKIQWTRNGSPIPGAVSPTLVYTTTTALADNGAQIRAIVYNNINTNTSTAATLAVDANTPPTLTQHFLKTERWTGIGGTAVQPIRDLIANSTPPNTTYFLASGVNLPQTNPDVNDFGVRISGWIKPSVTGDYDFFIRSDDASQLYLNPTNSTSGTNTLPDVNVDFPIAEETGCCEAFKEPILGFPQPYETTTEPIHLEAGKLYGIVVLMKEGGGGDFVQVAWRLTNSPVAAATLSPIPAVNCWTMASSAGERATITTQPQSTLRAEGQTASFSVGVTTTPVAGSFSLQWLKNGSPIPGATGNSYVTPPVTLADDNSLFQAIVYTLVGALTSSPPAVLDVISDTNPPVVIGSGALAGATRVGLTFDEALDPVTGANPANYLVNGVAATAARVLTNNPLVGGYLVELTVAAPVTAPLTLTVSGVKDRVNNTMPSTVINGTVIGLNYTDIGSPAGEPGGPDPSPAVLPAIVNVRGPGAIDVLCNGNDYWNNADGFNFLWTPKTNNFDVKVRVASVQNIDNWSAGAIEVREGPVTANGAGWELARHYFIKANYGGAQGPALDGSGAGANSFEHNGRRAPGDPTLRETSNGGAGQSQGWGGAGAGNMGPVNFPNAWIRIARVRSADGTSDHLFGYLSTDGVTWDQRQDVDLNDATHAGWLTSDGVTPAGPWPSVCYVGLGSTSHTGVGNNNDINAATGLPWQCWVSYRDFGDFGVVVTPTLSIVRNPNGTITLTFTGNLYSATNVQGPYAIMTGATSPLIVNPQTGPTATFYRAGP